MPIKYARRQGSQIHVTNDDGSSVFLVPNGRGYWIRALNGGGTDPDDPTTFNMVSNDGLLEFTIQEQGMIYARDIMNVGLNLGLGRNAIVAAFMCVMVEAPPFLMYANETYPESLNYPHDAVGSDHDSLGLFQQRPAAGWGTVAQLMDSTYNARAFFGGSTGPNNGSPAGLLDISPAWDERATLGAAVQAVQVSAHPERYDNWTDACFALYDAMAGGGTDPDGNWVWPFDPRPYTEGGDMSGEGSAEWGVRSGFAYPFHEGMDFGYGTATAGANIASCGDGTVAFAGVSGGFGNHVKVNHPDGTHSSYSHMTAINVSNGDTVSAGDILGTVGNTGDSFGAHLHFETHSVPAAQAVSDRSATSVAAYGGTSVNPRTFLGNRIT